ncbi:MAG: hypothetical protein WCP21_04940 [Armatimonadota bacterium]
MNGQVLVLNQNYEPLNVCSWRRAVALLCLGKVIALEHEAEIVRSARDVRYWPETGTLASTAGTCRVT